MILTGNAIALEHSCGRISIEPYRPEQLNTNSYDVTLGNHYLYYTGAVIDPAVPNPYQVKEIPADGLQLAAGEFILCSTVEQIGSEHFVPILHAKSSTARCGLFVHVTADLIDIGSFGQITLQLYATLPVKIYPGMRLAQVTFWKPYGKIDLYQGKYQHSQGPQASQSYKDSFFNYCAVTEESNTYESN